jgi:uncharacterized protein YeaO (DUF488 family)
MRVREEDLESLERDVNKYLKKVKIEIRHEEGHIVLDMKNTRGVVVDTLIPSGLTKREAHMILWCLYLVLEKEKEKKIMFCPPVSWEEFERQRERAKKVRKKK